MSLLKPLSRHPSVLVGSVCMCICAVILQMQNVYLIFSNLETRNMAILFYFGARHLVLNSLRLNSEMPCYCTALV